MTLTFLTLTRPSPDLYLDLDLSLTISNQAGFSCEDLLHYEDKMIFVQTTITYPSFTAMVRLYVESIQLIVAAGESSPYSPADKCRHLPARPVPDT